MLKIGCHLSASKGFKNMGEEAISIGGNTFQFFTRNPRGSKAKAIDETDIKEFLKLVEENNFSKILGHAPYTLNACSADENTRKFAVEVMKDDLERMEYIPNNLYNFHPGSYDIVSKCLYKAILFLNVKKTSKKLVKKIS